MSLSAHLATLRASLEEEAADNVPVETPAAEFPGEEGDLPAEAEVAANDVSEASESINTLESVCTGLESLMTQIADDSDNLTEREVRYIRAAVESQAARVDLQGILMPATESYHSGEELVASMESRVGDMFKAVWVWIQRMWGHLVEFVKSLWHWLTDAAYRGRRTAGKLKESLSKKSASVKKGKEKVKLSAKVLQRTSIGGAEKGADIFADLIKVQADGRKFAEADTDKTLEEVLNEVKGITKESAEGVKAKVEAVAKKSVAELRSAIFSKGSGDSFETDGLPGGVSYTLKITKSGEAESFDITRKQAEAPKDGKEVQVDSHDRLKSACDKAETFFDAVIAAGKKDGAAKKDPFKAYGAEPKALAEVDAKVAGEIATALRKIASGAASVARSRALLTKDLVSCGGAGLAVVAQMVACYEDAK